jgi:hypothetical protein
VFRPPKKTNVTSIPVVKVVTTTAHGLSHETTTRGKQPDTLITVLQPPGLYGPLLYPTSITGTAGLTLDFTVIRPVSRRGTEYTCDENALHRAYRAKVTKHYECLQAKKFWFVPVVAATSGALHPETLCLLYDFALLKTDAAEQNAVANSLRSPLTLEQLCQRCGATFAQLRMEAQLYSLRASATRYVCELSRLVLAPSFTACLKPHDAQVHLPLCTPKWQPAHCSNRTYHSREQMLVLTHPGMVGVGVACAVKDLFRLAEPLVRVQQIRVVAQRRGAVRFRLQSAPVKLLCLGIVASSNVQHVRVVAQGARVPRIHRQRLAEAALGALVVA